MIRFKIQPGLIANEFEVVEALRARGCYSRGGGAQVRAVAPKKPRKRSSVELFGDYVDAKIRGEGAVREFLRGLSPHQFDVLATSLTKGDSK